MLSFMHEFFCTALCFHYLDLQDAIGGVTYINFGMTFTHQVILQCRIS